MNLPKQAIDLIKQFEGCKLTSYQDSVGIWTIGYGTTGKDIGPGMTISAQEAEERLARHIASILPQIDSCLSATLNDNQLSAVVSLVYNIGIGAFKKSTLLMLLEKGAYDDAAKEFLRWDKAAGKPLLGLAKRRKAEKAIFELPVTTSNKLPDGPSDDDIKKKLQQIENKLLH